MDSKAEKILLEHSNILELLMEEMVQDDAGLAIVFITRKKQPTVTAIMQLSNFDAIDRVEAITAMSRAQIELLTPSHDCEAKANKGLN